MKHSRSILTLPFALACFLLLAVSGCATNVTPADQADEAVLVSRVETRLAADPDVNPFDIGVDYVEPGVVRLEGMVDTAAEKRQAIRVTMNTRGVDRIIDSLQVGTQSAGEIFDDERINATVDAKLIADLSVAGSNIDVDTVDGVVTLSGVVKTREAREEAEEIARNTEGVRDVVNRLEVQ